MLFVTVLSHFSVAPSLIEWSLAGLPTKMGGLGLRNAALHSPAAFLASQAACHELCLKLDPNHTWNPGDNDSDSYAALQDFNARVEPNKLLTFNEDTRPRQQVLSQDIDSQVLNTIREANSTNTASG